MRPLFPSVALMALILTAAAVPAAPSALAGESSADSSSSAAVPAAPAPAELPKSVPLDKKARMEALSAGNPEAAKLTDMAQKLYKGLSQEESQRLVAVRTGFGMVRVAELARDDIGKTAKLCGQANPSLKKNLDGQFAAFQSKIMPEVDIQEKHLQDSLNKNNFTHPDEIRAFLDQLDKTMLHAKTENEKNMTRSTTAEDCRSLGDSMDANGGRIVDALKKITWPDEKTGAGATK